MKKLFVFIVLIVVLIGVAYFYDKQGPKIVGIGIEAAKAKVEKFVNENLMQPGVTATIKEVIEENNLYKVLLSFNGQDITAYLTKDGKKFFPNAMDIEEIEKQSADAQTAGQTEQPKEISKTDKPKVELFIMSYCPYGTQIQKGIIPAAEALAGKIDFSMKFVDYAMHGDKEIDENLRQYCIQKEEPAKLFAYLKCFLKESKAEECVKSSGVDANKLSSCIAITDQQFKVKEKALDKSTWSSGQYPPFDVNKDDVTKYSVQGSPTLIINGVQSSSARDSASLLKLICSAFNNPPEECNKELSSIAPSAGFGEGTDANASSAANCSP